MGSPIYALSAFKIGTSGNARMFPENAIFGRQNGQKTAPFAIYLPIAAFPLLLFLNSMILTCSHITYRGLRWIGAVLQKRAYPKGQNLALFPRRIARAHTIPAQICARDSL